MVCSLMPNCVTLQFTSRIEVSCFKSGKLLLGWKPISEFENGLIDLSSIGSCSRGYKCYSVNTLYVNIDCDAIGVRRIFDKLPDKPLWEICCPKNIPLNVRPMDFAPLGQQKLRIVYFLNCFVSQYWEIVFKKHFCDLCVSGVFGGSSDSLVKIVVNGTPEHLSRVVQLAEGFLGEESCGSSKENGVLKRNYEILWSQENCFEYPGIRSFHETSMALEGADYVIYSHCKGLSHLEPESLTTLESAMSSIMILRNIYVNVDILNTIVSLNKIGPGLGGSGWMWFNFYMCRASYAKTLHVPVRTERRHYYESWLGDFPSDFETNPVHVPFRLSDGLSLVDLPRPAIGSSWDPQDIFNHVHKEKLQINSGLDQSFEVLRAII